MNILLVGIGGFFGAITRFFISTVAKEKYGNAFPYGTFFINIIGSFLLGMLFGAEVAKMWILLCGTGFMGGFTTFSTYQLEMIQLIHKREGQKALLYFVMSNVIGIGCAFAGFYIGGM
ncbi:fluoride efflux transporter CrcB [Bacillus sp. CGMCC 1.60114]|uniref:fluoride efflux transporter CrcB n=1 Tax=unclassified Bacillus (in: firmicutes) TaxID=185979 RepID=UPI00362DC003